MYTEQVVKGAICQVTNCQAELVKNKKKKTLTSINQDLNSELSGTESSPLPINQADEATKTFPFG